MSDHSQDCNLYVDMENLTARFLHSYNANSLQYIAKELFLANEESNLRIDQEDIKSIGYSQIMKELQRLEIRKNNRDEHEISLWASPYYEADNTKMNGKMICDIYTYRIYRQKKEHTEQCELIISKLEASFVYHGGELKISGLTWQSILSMIPWDYPQSEGSGPLQRFDYPALLKKEQTNAEAVIKIRNLQNYFFERKMNRVSPLFAQTDTTSLYLEPVSDEVYTGHNHIVSRMEQWISEESENNGLYSLLGISSAPLIEVNPDGTTAEGEFLIEVFQILKERNNQIENKSYPLLRRLCYLKSAYIQENGSWKILSMHMKVIAELPAVNYISGKRYDRMSGFPNDWSCDNHPGNYGSVEGTYQIENIVNRWVYSCRAGKLIQFYENYMKNNAAECRMLIRSQGEKSRCLHTEEAIRDKLSGMDRQYHDLMYSYHTATTPVIEFSEDGVSAKGTWFDHSATNLLSEASSREQIPYMVFVAKYVHEFRKLNGEWKLTDFYWEPIISLPDWEYNSILSKGFVTKRNAETLPNPFI